MGVSMKYTKPLLTFESQAGLHLSRGLLADKAELISRLQSVNYYRLSAYLYPFRQESNDNFNENAALDLVWKHYYREKPKFVTIITRNFEHACRQESSHPWSIWSRFPPVLLPR